VAPQLVRLSSITALETALLKIVKANREYEEWFRAKLTVVDADLDIKHAKMLANEFAFLRATYFRWAQLFPELCQKLCDAPEVLAVADLHVEQFSTWRDSEGRLVWGINDFDECYPLPYTNDLVRLATSASKAIEIGDLQISLTKACEVILAGYLSGIERGGMPFVLEDNQPKLRTMAVGRLGDPAAYWTKLQTQMKPVDKATVPDDAIAAMSALMPPAVANLQLFSRVAGAGSLGRQRFVMVGQYMGGRIIRECKALLPSAAAWARGDDKTESLLQTVLQRAIRCKDPFLETYGNWVVRRLAPDCSRIELSSLPKVRDESLLLKAMGFETANIHLGTPGARQAILEDLQARSDWLVKAVRDMSQAIRDDHQEWCARKDEP